MIVLLCLSFNFLDDPFKDDPFGKADVAGEFSYFKVLQLFETHIYDDDDVIGFLKNACVGPNYDQALCILFYM